MSKKYYAAVAESGHFEIIGARSDDKAKIQEFAKTHECPIKGHPKYHCKERSETDDLLSSICGVEWL